MTIKDRPKKLGKYTLTAQADYRRVKNLFEDEHPLHKAPAYFTMRSGLHLVAPEGTPNTGQQHGPSTMFGRGPVHASVLCTNPSGGGWTKEQWVEKFVKFGFKPDLVKRSYTIWDVRMVFHPDYNSTLKNRAELVDWALLEAIEMGMDVGVLYLDRRIQKRELVHDMCMEYFGIKPPSETGLWLYNAEGELLTGELGMTGQSLTKKFGTRSAKSLNARERIPGKPQLLPGHSVEPVVDNGKHVYVKMGDIDAELFIAIKTVLGGTWKIEPPPSTEEIRKDNSIGAGHEDG